VENALRGVQAHKRDTSPPNMFTVAKLNPIFIWNSSNTSVNWGRQSYRSLYRARWAAASPPLMASSVTATVLKILASKITLHSVELFGDNKQNKAHIAPNGHRGIKNPTFRFRLFSMNGFFLI